MFQLNEKIACDFTNSNTTELMKSHKNLSNTVLPLHPIRNSQNINTDNLHKY